MLNTWQVLQVLNERAYKVQDKYIFLNGDKQKDLNSSSKGRYVIRSLFALVLCRCDLDGHS